MSASSRTSVCASEPSTPLLIYWTSVKPSMQEELVGDVLRRVADDREVAVADQTDPVGLGRLLGHARGRVQAQPAGQADGRQSARNLTPVPVDVLPVHGCLHTQPSGRSCRPALSGVGTRCHSLRLAPPPQASVTSAWLWAWQQAADRRRSQPSAYRAGPQSAALARPGPQIPRAGAARRRPDPFQRWRPRPGWAPPISPASCAWVSSRRMWSRRSCRLAAARAQRQAALAAHPPADWLERSGRGARDPTITPQAASSRVGNETAGDPLHLAIQLARHAPDRPSRATKSRIGDFSLQESPETRTLQVSPKRGPGPKPRNSGTIRNAREIKKCC